MVDLKALVIISVLSACLGFAIESKDKNLRIIGGNDAVDGQFPYQVSIRLASTGSHSCGGSILNPKWILTAAHCIVGTDLSVWSIFAGNVSLRGRGVSRQIFRAIIQPSYGSIGLSHDVALLDMTEALKFSKTIQPIKLEPRDVGAAKGVVSGWGWTATPMVRPDILQYLNKRILATEQCRKYYGANFNADVEICASAGKRKGACTGDSGGPLVVNGRQVGIVSWSLARPCGNGVPDIYVKVSAFINWIEFFVS